MDTKIEDEQIQSQHPRAKSFFSAFHLQTVVQSRGPPLTRKWSIEALKWCPYGMPELEAAALLAIPPLPWVAFFSQTNPYRYSNLCLESVTTFYLKMRNTSGPFHPEISA